MDYKWKNSKKQYHKKYHAEWYKQHRTEVVKKQADRKREIKEWFIAYKATLKCELCPENHPACLDFHHRGDAKKDGLVSIMVAHAKSKKNILAEIAKCNVLCSNCHRKLHYTARMNKKEFSI